MMPQTEEAAVATVIDADVVEQAPRVEDPTPPTIKTRSTRVLEAGATRFGMLGKLADDERVQARLERIQAAWDEVKDGIAAKREDPDEVFLAQFHMDGDTRNPVLPERFAEYKWACDQIQKRRDAEVKRREARSEVDEYLELARSYGGPGAAGTGGALALVDAMAGGVPNAVSLLGAVVGGGYAWYKTRELRKAGRDYRRELIRRAAMRERMSADEATVDGGLVVEPIARAEHEDQAVEFVRRALLANELRTRPVLAERRLFGWRVVVDLVGGTKKTPADVAKAADRLEVDLGLGENGILVQPSRDNRARVTLWVIERDPFADLPAAPSYAARSRSVLDPIYVGQRLDGALVSIQIPSTHGVVLAPSGGGKSILIRALVDGIAACRDAIAWDLDPSGRGQAAQAKAFRRRALSPEDCTTALARAVQVAQVRAALNLDDDWPVSEKHPALVVFVDEFPQLDDEGKDAALQLLRIGRKAGVWLVFAAQDPKGNTLGADVVGEMGLQAGGPGLNDWRTRMLFGDNAASEGWTPGRYKPKLNENDPRDAGVFYLKGTAVSDGFTADLPMPSKVVLMGKTEATNRTARYVEDGLVEWDTETLGALGKVAASLDGETSVDDAARAQQQAAERREQQRLTDEERAVLAGLIEMLTELVDDGHTEIAAAELSKSAIPVLAAVRGDDTVTYGKTKSVVSAVLRKCDVPSHQTRGEGAPG